ncbi:MAG: recombinase family protein, partial [Campylobacterota bacterium]|nr:recombinase family protein [Campylobacterota bacterium]
MKAILISRVSDHSQVEAGNSLPAQTRRIKQYLKRKDSQIIKEYSFDESAYKEKRDDFDEILDFIKSQKEVVVVAFDKVDRFSRNVFDKRVSELYEMAIDGKIELHFVSDGQIINSNISASDKFRFSMSLGLAKYYSDAISDNVKRAQEQKLRKGEWPAKAIFGYDNVDIDENKKWIIPHEFNSLVVKKMFDWYASSNYSLLEIARKLRKELEVNKSKSMVHKILGDKFYIGIMTWGKQEYPHYYETFVEETVFEKVQDIMHGRKDKNKLFKYAGKEFSYRGLMRCHECGCAMTPQSKKRKLTSGGFSHHTYYSCTNYHKIHDKTKYIKESIIDEQFAQIFEDLEIPKEQLKNITATLKEAHQSKNEFYEKQYKHLQTQLKRYKRRIEVAYEDRLDESITKDHYEQIRQKSQREIDKIKTKMDQLDYAEKEYYMTTAHLVELGSRSADIFIRSKPMEKRALINFVLQNATIKGEKLRYEAKFPFNMVL